MVKCRSVSRLAGDGTADCPVEACEAWIEVKRSVDSRMEARAVGDRSCVSSTNNRCLRARCNVIAWNKLLFVFPLSNVDIVSF